MMENTYFSTKRVAAYCRVSTDKEIQKSSLAIQTEAFQQTIQAHPGWKLVKVYADEGLTGTSAKGRVQFQKMINDARKGKIDYILAKSISRFARNTVDALNYTRELKEIGVGVYFDEQSLDTLSVTSEIFLTIHAAFAQEESHSISENQKRGFRNRFAMGIPKWSNTYGYRCTSPDQWKVHAREATVIQRIFDLYTKGKTQPEICEILMQEKITPPGGLKIWHANTVSAILHNEKYIGDVEMQKCYVADYLTHKKVKNKDSKLPKYYAENHHPAIVDRRIYQLAQNIMLLKDSHRGSPQHPFYGFLKCPHCGENMVGITLKTKGLERAWTCGGTAGKGNFRKERTDCQPACVKEKYIVNALKIAFTEKGIDVPSVEYFWLKKYVKTITFSENNWSTMLVNWLDGTKNMASIEYEKPSEIPTENVQFHGREVYFDGKLMGTEKYLKTAAESVLRIMDYLQQISITDDDFCPIVLKPHTEKGRKKS